MFKTTIMWAETPDPGDVAKTYSFPTRDELNAFIKGVEEASGWLNHSFEEEGFVVPEEAGARREYLDNRQVQV